MGTTVTTPRWPGRRTEAVILLVILVIAAWFRFYALDTIPPGADSAFRVLYSF